MTLADDEVRAASGEAHRPLVVVGIDASSGSRWAVVEAMRSAADRGARLRVVAVYEPPQWHRGRTPGPPRRAASRSRTRCLVADIAVELGVDRGRGPDVLPGRPAEVLLVAARGADELVVGHRRGAALASTFLVSVGFGCVLHAP